MPGKLRFDHLDVRDPSKVDRLVLGLKSLAKNPQNWHPLEVKKKYYFAAPSAQLPFGPGWYVICDDMGPLYVGTAEDLNARLNSENGSRDQFANPKRENDPERNFIKSFSDQGIVKGLRIIWGHNTNYCHHPAGN
ncbi:MAG: hypothetical protein WC560_04835 [Syntrophales bacterium]